LAWNETGRGGERLWVSLEDICRERTRKKRGTLKRKKGKKRKGG